jgi:hypothetical protein
LNDITIDPKADIEQLINAVRTINQESDIRSAPDKNENDISVFHQQSCILLPVQLRHTTKPTARHLASDPAAIPIDAGTGFIVRL